MSLLAFSDGAYASTFVDALTQALTRPGEMSIAVHDGNLELLLDVAPVQPVTEVVVVHVVAV